MKKIIIVVSLLVIGLVIMPKGAEAKDFNETLGINQELNNKIVIINMDDLNKMNQNAVRKYNEMLEAIPEDI